MAESMTIERRDFLRIAGMAAAAPWAAGASACGGAESGEMAEVATAWSGYADGLIVDALSGPIQFNIPQEALPLGDVALAALERQHQFQTRSTTKLDCVSALRLAAAL